MKKEITKIDLPLSKPNTIYHSIALFAAIADLCISLLILFYANDQKQYDWFAYIKQGEAFLDGERDYNKIEGPAGPVAYPGLHVYWFALLCYTKLNYNYLHS